MYDVPNFFDEFDTLNRKIDQFLSLEQPHIPCIREPCLIYDCPSHSILDCPRAYQYPEFVQNHVNTTQSYAQTNNDHVVNTYNHEWWNHSNFL